MTARHLNARAGEHNGISPLTKTKVKPKGMVLSTLQKQNTMICHDNTSTPVKKYHDIYREKKNRTRIRKALVYVI